MVIITLGDQTYDFRNKNITNEITMHILQILMDLPDKCNIFMLPNNIWTIIGSFMENTFNYRLSCSRFYDIAQHNIPVHLNIYINEERDPSDLSYPQIRFFGYSKYIEYYHSTSDIIQTFIEKNIVNSITLAFFDLNNLPHFLLNDNIKHVQLLCCKNIHLNKFPNLETLKMSIIKSEPYIDISNNVHSLTLNNIYSINIDFSKMPHITSLNIEHYTIDRDINVSCLAHLRFFMCCSYDNVIMGNHLYLEKLKLINCGYENNIKYFASGIMPSLYDLYLSAIFPLDISNMPNVTTLSIHFMNEEIIHLEPLKHITNLCINASYKVYDIEYLPVLLSLTLENPGSLLSLGFTDKITSLQTLKIYKYNDHGNYYHNRSDFVYRVNTAHMKMLERLDIDVGIAFGRISKNIKYLTIIRPIQTTYIDLMHEFPELEELAIENYDTNIYNAMEIDLALYPKLKLLDIYSVYGKVDILNKHLLSSIKKVSICL